MPMMARSARGRFRDADERKEAVRKHAMELDQKVRRTFTPGVITGYDIQDVTYIVVGKEIDGGRRDDHRRLLIQIKGEPDKWMYDLEYRYDSAKIPADAVDPRPQLSLAQGLRQKAKRSSVRGRWSIRGRTFDPNPTCERSTCAVRRPISVAPPCVCRRQCADPYPTDVRSIAFRSPLRSLPKWFDRNMCNF